MVDCLRDWLIPLETGRRAGGILLVTQTINHGLPSSPVPAPMAERSNALSCPLAVIARRSLCPEKLGSNPGQGSKGINFSGWHGLDMSVTVTKRR